MNCLWLLYCIISSNSVALGADHITVVKVKPILSAIKVCGHICMQFYIGSVIRIKVAYLSIIHDICTKLMLADRVRHFNYLCDCYHSDKLLTSLAVQFYPGFCSKSLR